MELICHLPILLAISVCSFGLKETLEKFHQQNVVSHNCVKEILFHKDFITLPNIKTSVITSLGNLMRLCLKIKKSKVYW